MRLAALAAVVAMAACDDGYDVRVIVTPTRIESGVYASSCGADQPSPGSCSYWSDAGNRDVQCEVATGCEPLVHLEKDGVTVAQGSWVLDNPPPADELVIDGCSKEMRIPLPAQLPASPTITSWIDPHVEWSLSSPAARVSISFGTHFFGGDCTVAPSTTSFDIADPHDNFVTVTAWAAPVTTSVSLGEAHVRAAAAVSATGSAN